MNSFWLILLPSKFDHHNNGFFKNKPAFRDFVTPVLVRKAEFI